MGFCDLSGKNIIITGASSGLGRAASIVLSQLGATICLIGRNEDRLAETLSKMAGKDHLILPFELRQFSEYKDKFKYIVEQMGKLDGMIHFAGIRKTLPLNVLKIEALQEIIEINLYSFIELVKVFSKKTIVSSEGGSVVVASSAVALRGAAALTVDILVQKLQWMEL